MRQAVITIDDGSGDVAAYKRFAARVPGFLEKYPPGPYQLRSVFQDALSLKPGRLQLMIEAVKAGKSPKDLGLVDVDSNWMVCTRQLLDKEERVLCTGSAARPVLKYKDYEQLETAASQRLLAALGFAGDVFDRDEMEDIRAQGKSLMEQAPELEADDEGVTHASSEAPLPMKRRDSAFRSPANGTSFEADDATTSDPLVPRRAAGRVASDAAVGEQPATVGAPPGLPGEATASVGTEVLATSGDDAEPNPALTRQVQILAERMGRPFREPKTRREAMQMLTEYSRPQPSVAA